jgi:hypothetical protein
MAKAFGFLGHKDRGVKRNKIIKILRVILLLKTLKRQIKTHHKFR